jgi:uncharacterized protein (TIGR03437 family)
MLSALKLALIAAPLLLANSAFGQPVIGAIVNAASYGAAPLDSKNNPIGNNVIAQGSLFVVFGTGMGPSTAVFGQIPLPTSLPDANGTSISISSAGQTVSAYLIYASAGQVAAILPSNTPTGKASATLTYNGQTSGTANITVTKASLGIFTTNSEGNGPAVAQVYRGVPTAFIMGLTNAAQPGDTLVLYGTGLGAISGGDNVDPGATPAGSNVKVNIAGQAVPASYAGRSPGSPGIDQVNFTLPSNVATGCYVPVEVTANGLASNPFVLSIAPGGTSTCTHPLGLNAATMTTLDQGGTVNLGLFMMLQAVVSGAPAQGVGGLFDAVQADGAYQMSNRILLAFGGLPFPIPTGSCAVVDTLVTSNGFAVPNFSAVGGKELVATTSTTGLQLAGSNGNSEGVLHMDTGGYLAEFFGQLGKGTWTLTGPGGPDVAAFSASTNLPDNLVWTNAGNFSNVPRTNLTITWTGGNLNSQSIVTVFGSSVVINPTDPSKSRGEQFYCTAPASAGQFVVPSTITTQLPSSTTDSSAGEVAFGQLGISSGGGSPFTAPLTNGTLQAGLFAYGEAHTLQVTYQ